MSGINRIHRLYREEELERKPGSMGGLGRRIKLHRAEQADAERYVESFRGDSGRALE